MLKCWGQKGEFGFGPFLRLIIHLANMTLTCSVLASVHSSPWPHRLVLKCSAQVPPPPGSLPDPEDESPLFCDPTDALGGSLDCHHWFVCRAHLTTLLCCFSGALDAAGFTAGSKVLEEKEGGREGRDTGGLAPWTQSEDRRQRRKLEINRL